MKISVCMATYNAGRYLDEQIASILNQKFVVNKDVDIELVISDDGSTNGTIDNILSYKDDRIVFVRHTEHHRHKYNKGLFAATRNFENALRYATGELFFLSDQDDVWYPNKLDTMVEELKTHDFCASSFDWIDKDGHKYMDEVYYDYPLYKLAYKSSYYGFSMGFNKKIHDLVMPIPDIPQHDVWIAMLAKMRGNISILPEKYNAHRCFWGGGEKEHLRQWIFNPCVL